MDAYFKDLYKNNTALSATDRKRLVLSTGGMLVFDPLFSNKDVHAGLLADMLDQYKWIWLRLDDGTDIVVNDVEVKQGAVNTWVQYYDPKQGEMARILFSELVKKIDPVNAAESVVRAYRKVNEGQVYYENVSGMIDHNFKIDPKNAREYASQYREVEKRLQEVQPLLDTKPLEAMEKIGPLLVVCYNESMFSEEARKEIEFATTNYFLGGYTFFDDRSAPTIVDRYIRYLDGLAPNTKWFHVYVFDQFLELAFLLFHQACQACVYLVLSGKNAEVLSKYKNLLFQFEKDLKKNLAETIFYQQLVAEVTTQEEEMGTRYFVSFFAHPGSAKKAKIPVEPLGESLVKSIPPVAPKNKKAMHHQTFITRMRQVDFLEYTLWMDKQLDESKKLKLTLYNISDVGKNVIEPLWDLLSISVQGDLIFFNKTISHEFFDGAKDGINEELEIANQLDGTDETLKYLTYEYIVSSWMKHYYQFYLNAFTASVPTEIYDPVRLTPDYHYIKSNLPITLDGRLTMDCMVYAMSNAYLMGKEHRDRLGSKLYYVLMPFHVGVVFSPGVVDSDSKILSFQNGEISMSKMENMGYANAKKSCSGPPANFKDWEIFGEMASIHFMKLVALDLPYRVIEIDGANSDGLLEDILWEQSKKKLPSLSLFKPGFEDTVTGKNFIYEYLNYYTAVKAFRNNEMIVFWNKTASEIWMGYKTDKDLDLYKKRMDEALAACWSDFESKILLHFNNTVGKKQGKEEKAIFGPQTGIYHTVLVALGCIDPPSKKGLELFNELIIFATPEFKLMRNHLQGLNHTDLEKPFYIEYKLYPDY